MLAGDPRSWLDTWVSTWINKNNQVNKKPAIRVLARGQMSGSFVGRSWESAASAAGIGYSQLPWL